MSNYIRRNKKSNNSNELMQVDIVSKDVKIKKKTSNNAQKKITRQKPILK